MIIKTQKDFWSEFIPQNKSKNHEKHEPVEGIFYFFFFLKHPEKICKNYKNNPLTQKGEDIILFE